MKTLLFALVVILCASSVTPRFMDWVNPWCGSWNECRLAVLTCQNRFELYMRTEQMNALDDCTLFRRCPIGYELHRDPFFEFNNGTYCFLSGFTHSTLAGLDYGVAKVIDRFDGLADCLNRADISPFYLNPNNYSIVPTPAVNLQQVQITNWPTSCFQPYYDTVRQVLNRVGAI